MRKAMVKYGLAVGAMALVTSVLAQQSQSPRSWLEEMGDIDAQIQLLEKREDLAEALESASKRCGANLPKVIAIYRIGSDTGAQLYYTDGRLQKVKARSALGANAQVTSISNNQVLASVNCLGNVHQVALEFVSDTRKRQVQQVNNSSNTDHQDRDWVTSTFVPVPDVRLQRMVPVAPPVQ